MNQGLESADDIIIYDPTRHDLSANPVVQYKSTSKVSYFLFQAPDMQSLVVCKRTGKWAVTVRMAAEINFAFKSSPDGVVALMSIRAYRGIYGIIKVTGLIPPAQAGSLITPEFPVTWVRTMRVALRTVSQMKFNTGMHIGKTASDGRFDAETGYDLLLTMHRKPAWDWMEPTELKKCLEGIPDGEVTYSQPSLQGGNPDQLFDDDWIDRMTSTTQAYVNAHSRNKLQLHSNALMATVDRYGNYGSTSAEVSSDYYTGEDAGFIFCAANTQVVHEMVNRKLFGVPPHMSDIVVHSGAPLFLCDMSTQMLFGVFAADTAVSTNIDPTAFCAFPGGPSALPIQLRVRVAHECPPVHVLDPELRKSIFTMGPMFGAINVDITKKLANLFAARAGLQVGGVGGAIMNAQQFMHGGNRLHQAGAPMPGMVTSMYKPPFKHVMEVPIDIDADLYQVKRKVLGNNAATIKDIINEMGDNQAIKIRMRGIGSNYPEGPTAQELQEPLHFNVCAENERLLAAVVQRVQELVAKARIELCGDAGGRR